VKAPFPYFGGKSRIARAVWKRFGDVRNYVEPFAGSLAVLLRRPLPFEGTETVNDADGLLCNFWRALRADPETVARYADWPENENDLHARHIWLVGKREEITRRLEGDPEWFDAKAAGWWVWGISCWIGGGWCSGDGPWRIIDGANGSAELIRSSDAEMDVSRRRNTLRRPRGVQRRRLDLHRAGQGIHRSILHLRSEHQGVHRTTKKDLFGYFDTLSARLRHVRVCSGDWSRICGPTPTILKGLTAVFLDPPYSTQAGRTDNLYAKESPTIAHDVRRWALEHGNDPRLRIALCGYEGEPEMESWECLEWQAYGGMAKTERGHENKHRERIWFSPHCLKPKREAQFVMFRE
jgi:site-specific DNA-adenine methylase